MDEYVIKTDTNTIYMKIIRYIGSLMLGFFLGATFIKIKNGGEIDWMNFIAGTLCSFSLSIFPGIGAKHNITVNEDGIFARPGNRSYSGYKSEYKWDSISSVRLDKNKILIKTKVGSSDSLRLPYYTGSQKDELKEVLQGYNEWLQDRTSVPE